MDINEIHDLISDEPLRVKHLYLNHRKEFLGFGKRYGLNEDELKDIYQEAFLAIRKHALNGRLLDVRSSFKTYLFGIGKHKILDIIKTKKNQVSFEELYKNFVGEEELLVTEAVNLSPQQTKLRTYFKKLGEKCKEVLTLFYYRGLTIAEIVEHAGYSNANVVKAHKSRCMKSLKDMIHKTA